MEKKDFDFATLTSNLITKEDLLRVVDELKEIEAKVYQDGSIKLGEISTLSADVAASLKAAEDKDPTRQQEFFAQAIKFLGRLKAVRLSFAFHPKREFLKKIQTYLEKSTKEKVVIDTSFDPEMIGGIKIEYQGNYRDFSVSKELNKLFENQSEINSLIYKVK